MELVDFSNRRPIVRRRPVRGAFGSFAAFLFLTMIALPIVGEESPVQDKPKFSARFSNDTNVFSPQQTVTLECVAGLSQNAVTLLVSLYEIPCGKDMFFLSDEDKLFTLSQDIGRITNVTGHHQMVKLPVSFAMPPKDGCYLIDLKLVETGEPHANHTAWMAKLSNFPNQRRAPQVYAQTSLRCFVLDSTPMESAGGDGADSITLLSKHTIQELEEYTPPGTNTPWWKRFAIAPTVPALPKIGTRFTNRLSDLPRLSDFRERPSLATPGTAKPETEMTKGAAISEMEHKFESTTVPILGLKVEEEHKKGNKPVKPYLLEIEYRADVEQTIDIIVIETNQVGQYSEIGHSGIRLKNVWGELPQENPYRVHRVLFWPTTNNPVCRLSFISSGTKELFRTISVSQLNTQNENTDPKRIRNGLTGSLKDTPQRLVAGFLDGRYSKPLLRHADSLSWSLALVDQLRQNGYEGTMLTAAGNANVLYPSALIRTEPSGLDGTRDDHLELLAKLFDREKLTLIPAVRFDMPLNELEELLRQNPHLANELALIGPNGVPYHQTAASVQNVRYNPLHPTVQEAMLRVVQELLAQTAKHPSFDGLAVVLSPDSFAQLPDSYWGLDDATVARFEKETGVNFETNIDASENRFANRAQKIQTDKVFAESWIRWRTEKMQEFYARMAQSVTSANPHATLYLAGGQMLDKPEMLQFCSPVLGRRPNLSHALRLLGFDLAVITKTPGLVFLRPYRLGPTVSNEKHAIYQDFNHDEINPFFVTESANKMVASLFYHDAHDTQSPFDMIFRFDGTLVDGTVDSSKIDMPFSSGVYTPSGENNRKRFVKQLSIADVTAFFDGGGALPLGEDQALTELFKTYRQIPVIPFQTFVPQPTVSSDKHQQEPESIQPVTVRFARTLDRLYVYLVNDAPFPVTVNISGQINSAAFDRTVEMSGYDLKFMPFDGSDGMLSDVRVIRPYHWCGPTGILNQKVAELGQRVQTARFGVLCPGLNNPGFDLSDAQNDTPLHPLADWTKWRGDTLQYSVDAQIKVTGTGSLRLQYDSPQSAAEPIVSALLASQTFPTPETGRLFVMMYVGIPASQQVLPLNFHLQIGRDLGNSQNEVVWRSASVAATFLPVLLKNPAENGVRWQRVVLHFDKLPKDDDQTKMRLVLEISENSTIWIDDLQLYQVAFTKDELTELYRYRSVADFRCTTGRVSDLLTLLEGYWSQYLFQHVPATPIAAVPTPHSAPQAVLAEKNKPYTENRKPSAPPKPTKTENKTTWDRVKGWFGQ